MQKITATILSISIFLAPISGFARVLTDKEMRDLEILLQKSRQQIYNSVYDDSGTANELKLKSANAFDEKVYVLIRWTGSIHIGESEIEIDFSKAPLEFKVVSMNKKTNPDTEIKAGTVAAIAAALIGIVELFKSFN